jgi:transcriptional regulator with XRE-family HTH domain
VLRQRQGAPLAVSGGIRIDATELRYQRLKRVLTCRELAQEAGVAYSTLANLESGFAQYARPETIRKLARVLRVKPQSLVDVERLEV